MRTASIEGRGRDVMPDSNGNGKGAGVRPESVSPRQVLLELVFMGAALAAVKFFAQNTPVMYALIGGNIAARFLLIRRRHDWIFFLIGLVAGGGNDYMSMVKGVYYYTPKDILPVPIPVWMLVFWGHIFVGFRQLFQLPAFQGASFPQGPGRPDKRLILDVATWIILRIIIYNFVRQEPAPAAAYAAVIALRLLLVPPKPYEWRLMAVVVPLGLFYEAALIGFGLYVYYDAVFLGMPVWLVLYWFFMLPIFIKGVFDRVELHLARKPAGN